MTKPSSNPMRAIVRWRDSKRPVRYVALLCCTLLGLAGVASPVLGQPLWQVVVEPTLDIAGVAPSGELLVGTPIGATRLTSGEIVIADAARQSLHVFSASGALLRSVGRSGRGPGEFGLISWLGQCSPDLLFVRDYFSRMVSVLRTDGTLVRTFRLPLITQACSKGGSIVGLGDPSVAHNGSKFAKGVAPLEFFDQTGKRTASVQSVDAYDVVWFGEVPMLRPLGRATSVAVLRDRALVGTGDGSALAAYTLGGGTLPAVKINETAARPQRHQQERSVEDALVLAPQGRPRERLRGRLLAVEVPARLPAHFDILPDPSDLVWVQTSAPGDAPTRFSVYDKGGAKRAIVAVPVAMKVFEIGEDYILGRSEKPDGEQGVLMFRFARGR